MDGAALAREKEQCLHRLREYEKRGMTLDLSRGKPAAEQLALSLKLLDELDHRSILDSESGAGRRNYGGLDGIPEAKRLLAHHDGNPRLSHHRGWKQQPDADVSDHQPRHDRGHLRRYAVAAGAGAQVSVSRAGL